MNEYVYNDFVTKYGAVAYLKLIHLAEYLAERNIDIKKVNKKQIAEYIVSY